MFDQLQQQDLKEKVLAQLPAEADKTIGDALDYFEANDLEGFRTALRSITFGEVATAMTAKGKKSRSKPSIPSVENWKDETVVAEYRDAVLDLITKTGLGDTRGLAPITIRKTLGRGSEGQAREVLKALEESGDIAFTGETRGKRYVPAALLAEAEVVHAAEVEAREKAKAEAAARKAAEEAEAAS